MTHEPKSTPITDEAVLKQLRECGPFPPGSFEASMWRSMYGPGSPGEHLIQNSPPPTLESLDELKSNVARWEQRRRDRDAIEIITRRP